MKILAVVNQDDELDAPLVLLGYEIVEEDSGFSTTMYLGIESVMGDDDTIIAWVPTEEEIVCEIERRWGDWVTFRYLEGVDHILGELKDD